MKTRYAGKFIAVAAIAAAFVYGLAIGRYQVFPYNTLVELKHKYVDEGREVRTTGWKAKVSMFDQIHDHADVVMVGDSITAFAEWSEMLRGINVVNRGIAGDTAKGIYERIDSIKALTPNKIFIMVGTNDVDRMASAGDIFSDYKKVLESLKETNAEIYVSSTLLAGRGFEKKNSVLTKLNLLLKEYSHANKMQFIDINKEFAPNGFLKGGISLDGIHIDGPSYSKLAEIYHPYMVSLKN